MSGAWRWLREHAVNIVAGLVVAYMLIPIAVIFVFSFNDPAGKYNFTWVGFTLSHWSNAFGIPELNSALEASLKLALLATLVSTAIGTLMALALVRHQFHGRRAANLLIVVPMATPEIVMGASLLSFFLILGTPSLGFQTLLIAHVMFCISFVVVVVRSRLIGFDRNLEEAARDPGRGQRDRDDPLRSDRRGDGLHRPPAAPRREDGGDPPRAGGAADPDRRRRGGVMVRADGRGSPRRSPGRRGSPRRVPSTALRAVEFCAASRPPNHPPGAWMTGPQPGTPG